MILTLLLVALFYCCVSILDFICCCCDDEEFEDGEIVKDSSQEENTIPYVVYRPDGVVTSAPSAKPKHKKKARKKVPPKNRPKYKSQSNTFYPIPKDKITERESPLYSGDADHSTPVSTTVSQHRTITPSAPPASDLGFSTPRSQNREKEIPEAGGEGYVNDAFDINVVAPPSYGEAMNH